VCAYSLILVYHFRNKDTQGAFRKPTSIICNRYALLRRVFRKWLCRFIYSSVV